MNSLKNYDLARIVGVVIIAFVFFMTFLRVAGYPGLRYKEFSDLLKLAGALLGAHEFARLKQRRSEGEGGKATHGSGSSGNKENNTNEEKQN